MKQKYKNLINIEKERSEFVEKKPKKIQIKYD